MKFRQALLFPLLAMMFSCSGGGSGPQGEPITVTEAANHISAAAQKYDESIGSESLLNSVKELDESIDFNSQCTYSEFFLLLDCAFSGSLPAKTGARLIEGYANEESPSYSSYDESSPYTAAFRFVSDAGLVDSASFGKDFDSNTYIYYQEAWTLIDRFHWYYGTSSVDDFYAYANYEQRIGSCADEGKTANDSVAVSNLIPRANINSWSKEKLVNDPDSSQFYSIYENSLQDESGLNAVRDYLKPLLESENIVSLVEAMVDLHDTYGYAPFYLDVDWGFETINDISEFVPTASVFYSDNTIEESRKGGTSYASTLERFSPLFSIVFGNESDGEEYAEHYADFKYLNAVSYEENSELENEKAVIGDDVTFGDTGISLKKILADIGYDTSHYWLVESAREASSFYNLFTEENLNAVKGYCLFETMRHYIVLLPEEEHFNKWVLGSSFEGNRSENDSYYYQYVLPYYANDLVNYYSGTEEYAEDVAVIKDLYDELRETLVEKAQNSSWLSSEGAAKAKQKSDNMKYFFGNTSDKDGRHALLQIPYTNLNDPSLMDFVSLYQRTLWEYNLERVDTPPTNDFYFQCLSYEPFTANAFYMVGRNGILITMGYMAANERASEMSKEELLAHYGWVAGHEIGHGFDTNGFKRDASGNYNENWMSESDRNALADFSSKFQSYFDGYEALIGYRTSGSVVLNEALADNIGISLSLAIGKKYGFSAKDFFIEGAQAFGGYVSRNYFANAKYDEDSHPYGRCRINKAFSSFDEFHEAFETKEGDHMHVPEEERLVLY